LGTGRGSELIQIVRQERLPGTGDSTASQEKPMPDLTTIQPRRTTK